VSTTRTPVLFASRHPAGVSDLAVRVYLRTRTPWTCLWRTVLDLAKEAEHFVCLRLLSSSHDQHGASLLGPCNSVVQQPSLVLTRRACVLRPHDEDGVKLPILCSMNGRQNPTTFVPACMQTRRMYEPSDNVCQNVLGQGRAA
jgi:hypothetical protein